MQIAQMERQLGVTLIERRPQGLLLTDAGREVAVRAKRILAELRDLAEFAALTGTPLSAPLKLGVIPTIAPYLLPALLDALGAKHASLVVEVRETQTQILLDELMDGALDVLILALPIDHAEIETRPLRADKFLLAAPADRSFATDGTRGRHRRERISPELIRNDRLLLLEEGHCLRDQALNVCDLKASRRTDMLGASSLSTLVQMVARGLGLTLLPEISIPHETARSQVKLLRFAEPEPQRMLGMAWRKTSARKRDFEELGVAAKVALSGQTTGR